MTLPRNSTSPWSGVLRGIAAFVVGFATTTYLVQGGRGWVAAALYALMVLAALQ